MELKQESQEAELLPAIRQNMAVGQALGIDEILAQVSLIQTVMHRVMKEGEHYGTIPGCGDKKTLLQPGAQKLTMTFRLAPEYELQETLLARGHKEYRVICTLKSIQSGTFVGQGVGCCSSMESKYRWRGGSRKCPECGKEAIIKGKAEYGGGWLCFVKKGGCGTKWPDGAAEIERQSTEKVEHDNPADHFNTILKMAKKRAFVDATITATAASDIFTQDIGDTEEEETRETQHTTLSKPAKKAFEQTKAPEPGATPEQKDKFLKLLKPVEQFALQYAIDQAWILPTETLADIPLNKVPATQLKFQAIMDAIKKLMESEAPNKIEAPRDPEAAWRSIVVPFGKNKGEKFGDLEKNTLWWWCVKWLPGDYTGKDGTTYPPKKSDLELRKVLDHVREEYEFTDSKE